MTATATALDAAIAQFNATLAATVRTSPEDVAALLQEGQALVDALAAQLDEIAGSELREIWENLPVIYSEPEPAPVTGRLFAGAGPDRVALGPAMVFPA